ncbi:MAG: LD-carboxypeptidase [Acidobacteriota bacterium]|nr:LD-carboxypeptidase [Acidobacteriota bacterium]
MTRARTMRVPGPLPVGSSLAVVAPGSAVDRQRVEAGFERLAAWGYRPLAGRHLFRRKGDLAGTRQQRLEDLHWALTDPAVDAVWFARGGWGSATLLDGIEWRRWLRRSRWLIGFSDLTSLQAALLERGLCSWHAPMVADLATPERFVARDLRAMLLDPLRVRRIRPGPRRRLVGGRARGLLAGGNLTVLASLAGTRWQPDWRGRIVLLEEVGEAPYRIDRLLWQLSASGMLRGVRGVLLGQFTAARPAGGRPSRVLRDIFLSRLAPLSVPVLAGIPAGHGRRARAWPLGFDCSLDADRGEVRLAPPDAR